VAGPGKQRRRCKGEAFRNCPARDGDARGTSDDRGCSRPAPAQSRSNGCLAPAGRSTTRYPGSFSRTRKRQRGSPSVSSAPSTFRQDVRR
jgi:hypothetical protein